MKIKLIIPLFLVAGIFFSCNQNTNTVSENDPAGNHVPQWSKEAIWYQIFVERFRNGDPSNDPTALDITGTYPDSIPGNWKITPWNSDWYSPDDYFSQSPLPDQWNNLQLRRYGGDLQGVLDKLDYLESMGITAIYFNPLNDSPSLHKYDPRHWRHIDRNFGPNPKEDMKIIESEDPADPSTWKWTHADRLFLKVIEACHQRDIKVIMDYSWNHTGKEFWAFKDVMEKGKDSEFADWYEIKSFDDPATEENEFEYSGWAGVQIMPEIKKDITGTHDEIPLKGNLHSESVKQHIFSITKRWLDPNKDGDPSDGVDGYRLDVAEKVPVGFWREYRQMVKSVNPEAYLVGEIWWKSWPDELLLPHYYLQGDMFDAVMHYHWYRPARNFFADAPEPMKPSELVKALEKEFEQIPMDHMQAMMNLTASHDAPRTSTSLYNNGKYKYKTKPWDNPEYKIDQPGEHTRKIQKMLLMHQYTYIGAPHIWYGDEVGMWGADDPCTRKPMVWSDIQYQDETTHPMNKTRKRDAVKQDTALLNFYQQLIQLRKNYPVLVYGKLDFVLVDDANRTLAYSRYNDTDEIIAAFNKSDQQQILEIPVYKKGDFVDAFDHSAVYHTEDGAVEVALEPDQAILLIHKN
ncbi:MAG: glycoside hydrolase family 13 protein [Bacteroidales bacterium]|jgi:glycosidase|nr:glycoside hydrolase family 13 protein [Bacteroidales bacterium]